MLRPIIGVRLWALAVGVAVALGVPIAVYMAKRQPSPPAPPEPCVDKAWITPYGGAWECPHPGQEMSVTDLPNYWQINCKCKTKL